MTGRQVPAESILVASSLIFCFRATLNLSSVQDREVISLQLKRGSSVNTLTLGVQQMLLSPTNSAVKPGTDLVRILFSSKWTDDAVKSTVILFSIFFQVYFQELLHSIVLGYCMGFDVNCCDAQRLWVECDDLSVALFFFVHGETLPAPAYCNRCRYCFLYFLDYWTTIAWLPFGYSNWKSPRPWYIGERQFIERVCSLQHVWHGVCWHCIPLTLVKAAEPHFDVWWICCHPFYRYLATIFLFHLCHLQDRF